MERSESFTYKNSPENKYLQKVWRFFQFGNRTFADYHNFLEKAKNNGFKFIPLKDFLKSRLVDEKIIGMRHDVDCELNHAINIAEIEHAAGIRSTYFIRHTAKYYYKNISKNQLNGRLIEKLKYLQNNLGHEIGLHTDLMPIEIIYKKDPASYLKGLIEHLKNNGINITGVAPHGNLFHHIYRRKYKSGNEQYKKNDIFANLFLEFDVNMYSLNYEAYKLPHDIYFSDARFNSYKRWDFSCIDPDFFNSNVRAIILTHTIHWAPSGFYYFTVNFLLTTRYFISYVIEYIKFKRSN